MVPEAPKAPEGPEQKKPLSGPFKHSGPCDPGVPGVKAYFPRLF